MLADVSKNPTFPNDCVFWGPGELDAFAFYGDRGPNRFMHAVDPKSRWCRNIMLRPLGGSRRVNPHVPDTALTYFMEHGVIFCITPENVTEPLRRRFRDFGRCAVLSLHSNDRVSRVERSVILEGMPCLDEAVIIVTWNKKFPQEFSRHVAVVPNFFIDGSSRK